MNNGIEDEYELTISEIVYVFRGSGINIKRRNK